MTREGGKDEREREREREREMEMTKREWGYFVAIAPFLTIHPPLKTIKNR